MSGKDVGRPHLSGSHSIELLNANPEMLIPNGLADDPLPLVTSVSVGKVTVVAVPSFKSPENQPTTFDELQMGPSTDIFSSFAVIVATGHVPKALRIFQIYKTVLAMCIFYEVIEIPERN